MSTDDTAQAAYVDAILADVKKFERSAPDSAVMHARKAAEAMLKHVFAREVGSEPGKLMLDQLLTQLRAKKALPDRIALHFHTVQAFGNFSSHAQGDLSRATHESIQPCMAALDHGAAWYRREFLKRDDVPAGVTATPAPEKRRRPWPLIAGGAVVVGGVLTLVLSMSSSSSPKQQQNATGSIAKNERDAGSVDAPPLVVADAPAAPPFEVSLSLQRMKGKQVAGTVKANEVLHTGMQLRFALTASESLNVYLFQQGDTGLKLVFPNEAIAIRNPIPAARTISIPDGDLGFELDNEDMGSQTLFLVASRSATFSEQELDALRSKKPEAASKTIVQKLGTLAKTAPCAKPTSDCDLKRGWKVAKLASAPAEAFSLAYRSDEGDDVIVGTFPYRHEP